MKARKARMINYKEDMMHFADETNFYAEDTLNESLDDDQISAAEEGFMKGYLGDCYV